MIFDHFQNASIYNGLSRKIAEGLALLADPAVRNAPAGKHIVRDKELFYVVAEYTTKPHQEVKPEIHQKYLDIQFVATGQEYIETSPLDKLTVCDAYDPQKDAALYQPDPMPSRLLMRPGWFAIFWPNEPHAPGVCVDVPTAVRKIVVKVLME